MRSGLRYILPTLVAPEARFVYDVHHRLRDALFVSEPVQFAVQHLDAKFRANLWRSD